MAVVALVFVGIGALALWGLSSLWQAAGQLAGGPTSAASTTAAPTESPAPSATASPAPTLSPTLDPAAPALEALRPVYTAIDAARGGKDGLNGGEAKELNDLALLVGSRLRDGDYDGARQAASDLRDRVKKVHLDKKRSEALISAIDDLIAAIPD
jgi:hypothetical protein